MSTLHIRELSPPQSCSLVRHFGHRKNFLLRRTLQEEVQNQIHTELHCQWHWYQAHTALQWMGWFYSWTLLILKLCEQHGFVPFPTFRAPLPPLPGECSAFTLQYKYYKVLYNPNKTMRLNKDTSPRRRDSWHLWEIQMAETDHSSPKAVFMEVGRSCPLHISQAWATNCSATGLTTYLSQLGKSKSSSFPLVAPAIETKIFLMPVLKHSALHTPCRCIWT